MDSFFTVDGDWFTPTEVCRGPWAVEACHAGPPTGLLARASERLVPEQQLVRLTVELSRPVPMAGFRIDAEVVRAGRSVTTTSLRLLDTDGREMVTARGLHQAVVDLPDVPVTPYAQPDLDEAEAGPFAVRAGFHGQPSFADAVEMAYPPGENRGPGPKRAWMRTLPLLPDEEPSPFQRISPLADCGNALSCPLPIPNGFVFMNTDLTVTLHRAPEGEWFGTDTVSRWEPTGLGMTDSLLFDHRGAVGRAVQNLLIRPFA